MEYSFNVEDASNYGVDCAVMIKNIDFWISKNQANNKHLYNGKFWTYNSNKAFLTLFPFWTENQVRYIIKKLSDMNVIEIGNFNKNSFDRTNWYTFSDEYLKEKGASKRNGSMSKKPQMEAKKYTNGLVEIPTCIIGTDNKPDINTNREDAITFFMNDSPLEWGMFLTRFRNEFSNQEFEKFKEVFNCKVDEESLEFTLKKIKARLTRFTINYLDNLKGDKNRKPTTDDSKPAYMQKPLS